MLLEKDFIYHIYNQGNNHRKIFFSQENYLFFLEKIKTYITPYADILAWCLMPNHFHLMILVKKNELSPDKSDTMTRSHRITKIRTLNNSIAIMLRSYTRAINKKNNLSGSLFRPHTKAECLNCPNGITPSFIAKNGITQLNSSNPENEYPQICFNYIHQNPVKAGLAEKVTEWSFSSAKDYSDLRNGKLINKIAAKNFGLIYKDES
jgi:putative transposase